MKRFIIQCLVFFIIFFLVDKVLIFIRNTAPQREVDKRLESIINGKIDASILVFGSSRAARDIIASEIANSLHTTAYNLSYPGSNILFHEYQLQKLLQFKNKKPGLIILAVDDPSELMFNDVINFRYDRLYPLVKYDDIRNTLIEKGEKNKILSDLFIAHQLNLSAFDLRTKHFKDQDTILADGSMPISYQGKKFNRKYATRYIRYDETKESESKTSSFRNFLKICSDNKINVLLALAPNFGNPTVGFFERMKKIADEKNYEVMMYDTTKPLYKNADYYFDAGHLTKDGASVFTNEISNYIKTNNLLK